MRLGDLAKTAPLGADGRERKLRPPSSSPSTRATCHTCLVARLYLSLPHCTWHCPACGKPTQPSEHVAVQKH